MIPGPEEARDWKRGGRCIYLPGSDSFNSNDFLLRKLGLKKRVHLIIGSLLNQKSGREGGECKWKSAERMQLERGGDKQRCKLSLVSATMIETSDIKFNISDVN